jgi:hypothetical protein
MARQRFFKSGYDRYIDDPNANPDRLVAAVENFGIQAFHHADGSLSEDLPTFDSPDDMALLATLAVICVGHNERYIDHYREWGGKRIQPLHDIREFFFDNLIALTVGSDYAADLSQYVAEEIYDKPAPKNTTEETGGVIHSSRTCTGIEYRDDVGEVCAKIPLVAASRDVLAYTDTEDDGERTLRNSIEDNTVYVPLSHMTERHRDRMANAGFQTLLETQREMLTDDQKNWLLSAESRLSQWIDRQAQAGRHKKLWENRNIHEDRIRLLKDIAKVEDTAIDASEPFTAQQLYRAIDRYNPDDDRKQATLNKFANIRSVAQTLSEAAEERGDVVVEDAVENGPNQYSLRVGSNYKQIDVREPHDLFELPCFANLYERFDNGYKDREELFSFARLLMWLPMYYDEERGQVLEEDVVDGMKEVISDFDWYDEDITEYQTRYEYLQGETDERYMVKSCTHEDMQNYCIGKDNCEYSIYQSLPFVSDFYQKLSEFNTEESTF